MAKLSEENIKLVCEELGIDSSVVETLIFKAKQKDDEERVPSDGTKKEKKDWVVIINDPEGNVPDNLQVWVAQKGSYIDEESGANLKWGDLDAPARLKSCAKAMRDNQKLMRRLGSLDSLADIFEFVPGKSAKEEGLHIKTKQPVALVRVNGEEILNNN